MTVASDRYSLESSRTIALASPTPHAAAAEQASGVDEGELAVVVAALAQRPLQLARAGLGQGAGGDEHDVLGRHADHLAHPFPDLLAHLTQVVGLGLGHHDERLAAPVPFDAEGDDVARPHAVEVAHGPLDVLGEDVPPADDD